MYVYIWHKPGARHGFGDSCPVIELLPADRRGWMQKKNTYSVWTQETSLFGRPVPKAEVAVLCVHVDCSAHSQRWL